MSSGIALRTGSARRTGKEFTGRAPTRLCRAANRVASGPTHNANRCPSFPAAAAMASATACTFSTRYAAHLRHRR
ncbi:MAG: hypothetical protein MZV64_01710 [Ignavibacteriales bacterium]|nr:hypothetical protein [Ignavibacteriales bacterium]